MYKLAKKNALLIINYPSTSGLFLIVFALLLRIPYVVEVASDADTYREKPFGWLVEIASNVLGRICVPKAIGALYVAQFLRDKWACDNGLVLSNVHIEEIGKRRIFDSQKDQLRIATVGAVSYRKGIDIIIDELGSLSCRQKIELHIVGPIIDEGLKRRINDLMLPNVVVICHGILKKSDVLTLLDEADLYIQASRSEGLPRSLIEAMSRGLPVICSNLPGVKGLVDEEFQFTLGKKTSLRDLLARVLESSTTMNMMSMRSIEVSRDFHIEISRQKRLKFYKKCKSLIP